MSGLLDIEKNGKQRLLLVDASLNLTAGPEATKVSVFPSDCIPRTTHQIVIRPHGSLETTVTVIARSDGLYMFPSKTGNFNIRFLLPYYIA